MTTNFFHPLAASQSPSTHAGTSWQTYSRLTESQWWSPAELRQWQHQQLKHLLKHCQQHVPWYREQFAAAGLEADQIDSPLDLQRVPILDRATYVRYADRLIASQLPEGTVRAGTLSTSGTTGIPVIIHNTNIVAQQWLAFAMRDLEWCGLDPRKRLASIRPSGKSGEQLAALLQGVDLPNWGQQLAEVVATGSSHFMDMAAESQPQLDWLRNIDPDYLLSFPSNIEQLARMLCEGDGVGSLFRTMTDQHPDGQMRKRLPTPSAPMKLPNLKAIQTIGEMLDADLRATIKAAFGVPVFDTYSCCEAGYVASPCPAGHGYHVHAENVIVEILNDNNQPCAAGKTGRIVLTTLHNFATPFIRYDIHDEATVGAERCPCGRGLPLLTAIHGKRRPMFRLPDGSTLSSGHVAPHIRKVGGFHQFQLEQTAIDRAILRIVPDATWNGNFHRDMVSALQADFGSDVTITVQVVDDIARSPGGKLQSTLVNIPPERSGTRQEFRSANNASLPSEAEGEVGRAEQCPGGGLGSSPAKLAISNFQNATPTPSPEHRSAGSTPPMPAAGGVGAIVYACSHARWLPETLRSVQSFSELMPAAERILYVTPNLASNVADSSLFHDVRTVPQPRHPHRSRFEAMLNCHADQAIFIDGDTLLIQAADELWELLDHFDIALAAAPQYFHSQALKLGIYDKLPRVSAAQPEWNAGVMVARITERFRTFVQSWSDLFTVCRQHNYEMDQAALRVALATSDLRIATLPSRYNFRAHMPQTIKGSVKLLHAHGDLPAIAARVNQSLDLRLYSPQASEFSDLNIAE